MANYYDKETWIYLNGDFVPAAKASMDFYSQSLHYGYAVFEGIRSYKTSSGETRIFKAQQHFKRLKRSAQLINMPFKWNNDQLIADTYTLLEKNHLQDAYIRPLVYAPANMGFNKNDISFIVIEVWKMAVFLGTDLLKVFTSSFQRPNAKAFLIEAKVSGHYINSILASQEAKALGFDEALLTDANGYVAEGPGANMFYEKDGILFTPPTGNILPGITRATVFEMCAEMNIPVKEKFFTVQELKQADAAFFCGTAAEVIGWKSLDETIFPMDWNNTISSKIKQAYSSIVIEENIMADATH